jgi:hypothetical protein
MSRRTRGRDRLGLGVLISKMLRVAKTAKITGIFSKPDFGTGGVERT